MIGEFQFSLDDIERFIPENGNIFLSSNRDTLLTYRGSVSSITYDPSVLHVQLIIVQCCQEEERVVHFYIDKNLGFMTTPGGLAIDGNFRISRSKDFVFYINRTTF